MSTLIKPQEVVNTGIYRAAPVNTRFDINIIAPHIKSAEERFLLPLLGSALYNDMILLQNANVSNYNPDAGAIVQKFPTNAAYESLWTSYVLRYIGYVIYYEALPYLTFQVSSKGIFTNDSEFASNGGLASVKFMQDNTLQKIDNLKPLIEKYLCDNKTTLPLFDSKHCDCHSCEDDNNCGCGYGHECGYFLRSGFYCRSCRTRKNNSTNIILY